MKTTRTLRDLTLNSFAIFAIGACVLAFDFARADSPVDIGSRRELFVDDYLIESMQGAELRLQSPQQREVVMDYNRPWEGNTCLYHTIVHNGEKYQMWYRGTNYEEFSPPSTVFQNSVPPVVCYAESLDGIRWTRPELGIVEWEGSTANNIVWPPTDQLMPDGSINGAGSFMAFLDDNPACSPGERYKGVAQAHQKQADGKLAGGLTLYKSPDGIHWSVKQHRVITDGQFDARNIILWDAFRQRYVSFYRDVARGLNKGYRLSDGYRGISTTTSADALSWAPKELLDYGDSPKTEMYDPAIVTYHRAPQLFVGFPLRYLVSRAAPENTHAWSEVSDIMFMTSRDGFHWKRWPEAAIRPGPQVARTERVLRRGEKVPRPEHYRWGGHCNNMVGGGVVETASDTPGVPNELSIYSIEGYYSGRTSHLRRYTYRLDGFVSVNAPAAGGEFVTRPLTFTGSQLTMNFSTSGAGGIRVEIQDAQGRPLEGFSLDDCPEIYGDRIDRVVTWKEQGDLTPVAGQPVRLRFVMNDADLYAIQFR